MLALLTGCLTDRARFEPPPDFPSSIEVIDPPSDRVILDPRVGGQDGGVRELELQIVVSDPNVSQQLEYRYWIDDDLQPPPQSPAGGQIIPATGEVERRVPPIRIPQDLFAAPGCHWIDLLVSSEFPSISNPRMPGPDAHLSQVTWWLVTEPEGGGVVDMRSCRGR